MFEINTSVMKKCLYVKNVVHSEVEKINLTLGRMNYCHMFKTNGIMMV